MAHVHNGRENMDLILENNFFCQTNLYVQSVRAMFTLVKVVTVVWGSWVVVHYIQLHVSDPNVDTVPAAIICHNVIFPSCYPNLPYTVPQWVEPGQYKGSNSTAVYYVILRHFLKEHQRYTQVSGIRALH